jgi:hypothetical protein
VKTTSLSTSALVALFLRGLNNQVAQNVALTFGGGEILGSFLTE